MQGGRKENGESNSTPGVLSVSTHYRLLLKLVEPCQFPSSNSQLPSTRLNSDLAVGGWELANSLVSSSPARSDLPSSGPMACRSSRCSRHLPGSAASVARPGR